MNALRLKLIEPFGTETHIQLDTGTATVTARLDPGDDPVRGERFGLAIEPDDLYFFDPENDAAIV